MDIVTKEVCDVSTTDRQQPSARAVCAFQATCDLVAGGPPHGGPDRHARLDGDGGARGEDPWAEAQERRRSTPEPSRHDRGLGADGVAPAALPRDRGADQVL